MGLFRQFVHRGKLGVVSLLILLGIFLLPNYAIAVSNQEIIALTNNERGKVGLSALVWNAALSSSAWAKANDMCEKDYWAHTAPDGTTAWTYMSQSGYAYTAAGENLAKGFSDDASVVAGWMASPGHKANILHTSFKEIGLATVACDFQGAETNIVVAHYGATRTVTKLDAAPSTSELSSKAKTDLGTTLGHSTSTPKPVEISKPQLKESFGTKLWRLVFSHHYKTDLLLTGVQA